MTEPCLISHDSPAWPRGLSLCSIIHKPQPSATLILVFTCIFCICFSLSSLHRYDMGPEHCSHMHPPLASIQVVGGPPSFLRVKLCSVYFLPVPKHPKLAKNLRDHSDGIKVQDLVSTASNYAVHEGEKNLMKIQLCSAPRSLPPTKIVEESMGGNPPHPPRLC